MGLSTLEPFILGGVASCTAEFLTYPIDLVKTRLQIQGQKIDKLSVVKYRGMFHCFLVIVKEEGLGSLYSG